MVWWVLLENAGVQGLTIALLVGKFYNALTDKWERQFVQSNGSFIHTRTIMGIYH